MCASCHAFKRHFSDARSAWTLHRTRVVEVAFGTAGTLSLTGVVLVWGLWLTQRSGASRAWRLLPFGVVPCVTTPLILALVLSDHVLGDVARGTLLGFALLVAVGTLLHAARAQRSG